MKKIFLAISLLLASSHVNAKAIISDTWITGNLPDQCGFIEGTALPVMSPVEMVSGAPRCRIAIDGVVGTHTYKIFARSAVWGDSGQVNFTFTAGVPSIPANIRVVP